MKTQIFFVEGTPAPQGSKTLIGTKTGRPRMIEGSSTTGRNKLKAWRTAVTEALRTTDPIEGPVHVEINFYMPHLKNNKTTLHAVKPDIDKLIRATLDAITQSGYWKDDAQVIQITATKERGHPTGAQIIIDQK